MTAYPNITLMGSTQEHRNFVGEPKRAGSGYQSSGGLYTVGITTFNLTGRIYIEGTLAANPQADDWFPIPVPNSTTPYIEYLHDPQAPGAKVFGYSFRGNIVWLRARLDRDYLPSVANPQPNMGYVDNIVLNTGNYLEDQRLSDIDFTDINPEGVNTITGNNLGNGSPVYAGSSGQTNVIMNFRTIRAGAGIDVDVQGDEIIVTNTGGGSGSATSFTQLSDTPSVIRNGVLVGDEVSNELAFTHPVPNTPHALVMENGFPIWESTNDLKTVLVDGEEVKRIELGTGLTAVITDDVAEISTTQSVGRTNREWVELQYTAGSTGNMNGSNIILAETEGVTATVVDPVHCVVAFTFTNRSLPPSQISMMGQNFQTNQFTFTNVGTNIATRTISAGSDPLNPNLMGNFTGPITLQLRMSDTNSSAPLGKRARLYVVFQF